MIIEGLTATPDEIDKPCEKCGLFPHPIKAVHDLPPEQQSEFDRHYNTVEPTKRRKVVLEARVFTNEDLVKQMVAKEEGNKIAVQQQRFYF